MGQFTEIKKEDIGFKFASGILSSDATAIDWFAEKLGLSPNQLPADIWMEEVPEAEDYTTAFGIAASTDYPQITRHTTVTLKKVANVNDTLWMAVDSSGNRMRNFINPSNHQLTNPSNPNNKGSASIGYQIKLYQVNSSTNNTSTQINLTDGTWMFYYKEGVLACSEVETPAIMGWSTGSNNDTLHAELFQYTGVNLLPSNAPQHGQVLAYNNPGGGTDPSFTWINNSGGSGSSGTVTDNDYGDITVDSNGALWTIDTSAVTYGKIQDVTAGERMLGRKASTSGPIEEFSATEVRSFVGIPETVNDDGYYADLTPSWVPSVDPGYLTSAQAEVNNLDVNQGGAVTWGSVVVPSININGYYEHVDTIGGGAVSNINFAKNSKAIWLGANGTQTDPSGNGNNGPQHVVSNASATAYLDANQNMWNTSTSANLGESGAGKASWANLYLEEGGDVEWYGGSAYIRHNDSLQADNSLVDDLNIHARGSLNLSIGAHDNTTVTSLNLVNSSNQSLFKINENSSTYTFYQGNPLTSQSGGTGHGSYSTGDILYCEFGNSSNLVKLPVGELGDIMYVGENSNGDPVPVWSNAGAFYNWTLQDEGGDSKTIGSGKHVMLDTDSNLYSNWTYTSDTNNPAGSEDFPFKIEIGLNSTIDVTNSGMASNVTGIVAVANGGTGADNAADARANLDVDQAGTDNSTPVTLTADSSWLFSTVDYVQLNEATQVLNLSKVDLFYDIKNILYGKNGGTGWGSQALYDSGHGIGVGDILFGDSTNGEEDVVMGGNKQNWSKLSIGNENDILQVSSSGVPTWTAMSTVVQDTNIAENNLQLSANRELNFPFNRELRFYQPAASEDHGDAKFNVEIESNFSGALNATSSFDFTGDSGAFKIHDPGTAYTAIPWVSNFTQHNIFTFPNKSGTLALTNDLDDFVSVGDTNVNISITGNAGGISGILPVGNGGTGNDSWDAHNLVHVNSDGTALTQTDLASFEGGYLNINRTLSGSSYFAGMMLFEDANGDNTVLQSSTNTNNAIVTLPSSTGTLALTTDTIAGAQEVACSEIIPFVDTNYPIVLSEGGGIAGLNNIHFTNGMLFNPVDDRLRGFANLLLENKINDATGADIHFHSDRNGGALQNDDVVGKFRFNGLNSNGTTANFAEVIVSTKDVTSGSEEGVIDFKIATNGAGNPMYSALKVSALAASASIKTEIGASSAASETHIAGNLFLSQVFTAFGGDSTTGGASINTIHKSGEFSDDNTSLMTSAAIDDHILSKNYMDNFVMQDSSDVSKSIGEGDYVKITSSTGANGTSWSGSGTAGDPWVLDISSPNDSTTATAGDGIDITSDEFSVDLKANGGLVIESAKLAVDLGASDITGTLGVADGGTGLSSYTAGDMLYYGGSGFSKIAFGSAGQILKIGTNPALPMWVDDGSASINDNRIPKGTGTSIENSSLDIDDQSTYSAIQPYTGEEQHGVYVRTLDYTTSSDTSGGALFFSTGSRDNQSAGHGDQTSGDINIETGFLKGQSFSSSHDGTFHTGNIFIKSGLVNQTGTYGTGALASGDITINTGSCATAGSNTAIQGTIKIGSETKEVEIGGGTAGDTIKLDADVTQIGLDSPSTNEVLTWDGTKAVWSAASGGATVSNEGNNRLVTSTGSGGGLDAEADLTYDSLKLTIGDSSSNTAYLVRNRPASGNDGGMMVVGGGDSKGTDKTGGDVRIIGGRGSGDEPSGKISFWTHASDVSASGTTNLNTLVEVAEIKPTGDLELLESKANFRGNNMGTVYKDAIFLTPVDFMHADSNKVAEINDSGGSITAGASTTKYYAIVQVPSGYKATHVHVHGSAGSNTERVYYFSGNITSDNDTTLMPNNTFGYVNTETTLDSPFTGQAGRYMMIEWRPANTTNKLYGAKVTLASAI